MTNENDPAVETCEMCGRPNATEEQLEDFTERSGTSAEAGEEEVTKFCFTEVLTDGDEDPHCAHLFAARQLAAVKNDVAKIRELESVIEVCRRAIERALTGDETSVSGELRHARSAIYMTTLGRVPPEDEHVPGLNNVVTLEAKAALLDAGQRLLDQAKRFVCSYLGYNDIEDFSDADEVSFMSLVVDLVQRLDAAEKKNRKLVGMEVK